LNVGVDIALALVTLVAIAVAVSAVSERFSVAAPLGLMVVGIGGSYLPFMPEVELSADLVLVGLLPPLLYAAAIRTSLVDFRTNKRPIALLSIGLVLFTTVGIAVLAHAIMPISWAAAFALGAVVAPPDAVAATTIARRVGMPRRIVTILEGESLVNDATAIVALRVSIAALAGSVSVWEVGVGFVVSAVGGVLVGVVVALVVGKIRRRIDDTLTDVAFSLLTPWIAYMPAEEIHVPGVDTHPSGVLAVVVAGLLLGHKSHLIQSASSRMFERTNWATVSFVLENVVFLLIGLQVSSIVDAFEDSELSLGRVVLLGLVIMAGVVALRLLWVYPATYLPRLVPAVSNADPPPPWQYVAVVGWAGMRGVVTLAAVFLLPADTPHRSALVLVAFVVTVGTLLLQGLTLPYLVRWLGLHGPDPHEDNLEEAKVHQAASEAGLAILDGIDGLPEDVRGRLAQRANDRVHAVWERLGGVDTPSAQYSRARVAMLEAERAEVLRLRDERAIDQTVLQRVLNALDVEESILDRLSEDVTTAERESELRPRTNGDGCEHLAAATTTPTPRTPEGCEECLRDGIDWVHLRLCMGCGHVGCCDSSPEQHGSRHHAETGHPVMRSFEAGEAWRWCFVDHLTG
jgi:CPA1 family monovalent cation:H+ antiporter